MGNHQRISRGCRIHIFELHFDSGPHKEKRESGFEKIHTFSNTGSSEEKNTKKRSSNKTKQRETPTKHITCATGERIRETCYSFCLFLTLWLTMQRKNLIHAKTSMASIYVQFELGWVKVESPQSGHRFKMAS